MEGATQTHVTQNQNPSVQTYKDPSDHENDITHDSGGQVRPRFQWVTRVAGQLACGELVVEPVLGIVRVAASRPAPADPGRRPGCVQLAWSDDYGPCHATGQYPVDRELQVRTPHHADQLLVRQDIDQATWRRGLITGTVARLIAAHLHFGPYSGLYRFAVNGMVSLELFSELRCVNADRPPYRPWVFSLMRHCQNRPDKGPVVGWGPHPEEREPLAATDDQQPSQQSSTESWTAPITSQEYMPTDTAVQLIDAAFALGVDAGRHTTSAAKARWLLAQRAAT
jgi:hypothetical protein